MSTNTSGRLLPTPIRKLRRSIQIGDKLQKTILVHGKPPAWIDVTVIENDTDLQNAHETCRRDLHGHLVRVIGVRDDGITYSVAGYRIGRPA